ncbi:MAG TPA: DUF3817 domain-containing protein [Crocinitomicaceae bacterium]|nr:DUF3817 domain-containing protein [Crocinitomicaceae bacterium]
MKTKLGQLRVLAITEGVSYLLLALTMPLKYMYEIGMPNKVVGMIHGILFILYCIWILIVAKKNNWSILKTLVGLAASLLPFATFIFDAKVLKNEA